MRFAASPAARNAFNAISDASIDYNELTGMSQKARSMERQTAFDSQAKMKQAEDYAEALVAAADAGAAATAAQGNASLFGSAMGGLSSIVGAIPMGGGGGGGGSFAPPMAFDSRSAIPSSVYGGGNVYGIGGSLFN